MAQFHLHAPSEHTVDGEAHDGEIHFVHKSSDGSALMVVGIFLDIAPKSDEWLGPVLDALETVNSTDHTANEAIVVQLYVDGLRVSIRHALTLVPDHSLNRKSYSNLIKKASKDCGIYNYPGSLTTPGCDETADWWVVQTPIQISSTDFGRLHQDLVEYHITDDGNNARPVQPLNGRTVTRYN
ncbi:unnamed protein product [Phytophthora fragariaefolia]|uniref:Carbonic anhydrase n=1 Tax=Phytophthora fragariaefolia TaxID=1490495 RepID=A0A9W6XVT6_9STRA|nr:unnamed protein product [Phytophthora fragariaefolia]